MEQNEQRDYITIMDEEGNEVEYAIEGMFDMGEQSYALLSRDDETIVMRVEEEDGELYLVGITDPEESEAILDAYQIVVEETTEE